MNNTLRFIQTYLDGLLNYYPWLFIGEKAAKNRAIIKNWKGYTEQSFNHEVLQVTKRKTINGAKETLQEWKDYVSKNKSLPSDMPRQEIIDEATKMQDKVEKEDNKFEKTRIAKEKATKIQESIEKAKPEKPETPKAPVKETPSNVAIGIESNVKLSAFNRAGIRSLGEKSPVHATAMYLYKSGVGAKDLKEATANARLQRDKDLEGLVKEIEALERVSPVQQFIKGRRIILKIQVSDIKTLQKFMPQAKIMQLYGSQTTIGGNTFSAYSAGQGFFKRLVGNVSHQLFGKVARRGSERMLTRAGIAIAGKAGGKIAKKVAGKGIATGIAAVIGGAGGPPAWLITAIAAVISFGKKAISLLGRKIKENKEVLYGMFAGGLALGFGVNPLGAGAIGTGTYAFAKPGTIAGIKASANSAMEILATGIVLPSIVAPIVIALIAVPLIIALILFIINSGAYIVPPSPRTAGDIESPYIGLEKEPSPSGPFNNSDLPVTVTYKITVKAKKGTLFNIRFENTCRVTKNGVSPNCHHPTPAYVPDAISPTDPYVFEYSQEYTSPDFNDSFVSDIFKVTADTAEKKDAQAATSAVVKIGKPPEECPAIWPTDTGYITQGAYTPSGFSHHTMEAIDIGTNLRPVFAGHSGQVIASGKSSCIGNYIEIQSSCEGKLYKSQYAHLEGRSVSVGQQVTMGQTIGLSGNTGSCTTGPHLHYRFMFVPSGNPKYPYTPPYMMIPYIPANIPRGCVYNCGVSL